VANVGEVRDAYSALADRYISLFGSVQQVHPDDLSLVRRQLGDLTGPVLDLGCGPGQLTGYLHSLGVDVSGIDLVPEFLSHAQAAHPGIAFTLGSIDTLNAPDHTLSGILAWYSLIHLLPEDLDGALARLHGALAPGGALLVGFFPGAEVVSFEHKVVLAYKWPVDEFAERLTRAGFVEIERTGRPADGETRAHAAIAARAG
jgi:trans-aconitate methyltransferase